MKHIGTFRCNLGNATSFVLLIISLLAISACGSQSASRAGTDTSSASPDSAIRMTMTGGSAVGFYGVLAENINSMVREEYPGSGVAWEPGSPAGGIAQVASGDLELAAAASPAEERAALEGSGPFVQTGPLEGEVVGVTRLYNTQRMHSVMLQSSAERYGIESFRDIATEKPPIRIALNQQGNYQNVRLAEEIFKAYGFSIEDIESWGGDVFYVASGEGSSLLADRKVDMFFTSIFIPDSRISDLSTKVDLEWISMEESKMRQAADELGFRTGSVSPGEYDFIERKEPTVSVQSDILTSPDVPEEDIYKLVKVMYEQQEDIRALHPSMSNFSPELMVEVQQQMDLHPGAERFYREKGLIE